jgi:hypothetical protein
MSATSVKFARELGSSFEAEIADAATQGLLELAHAILEAAKRDVPKGDPEEDPDPAVSLAESGHVTLELGGRFVSITFDAEYAAKQHEDLHLEHPRGGGPKYLERHLLAAIPKVQRAVASGVRKRLTGDRGSHRRRPRRP